MPHPPRDSHQSAAAHAATIGVLVGLLTGGPPAPAAAAARVHVVALDSDLGGEAATLIESAIADAAADDDACVVLRLDTPGGTTAAMHAICRVILGSPVPVVSYVGPAGARAASTGACVALAAPIAAMHTTSSIGTTTPGLLAVADPSRAQASIDEVALLARSLAERHRRNAGRAERALRDSVAASADEALASGVVDLLVGDLSDLLVVIDGWTLESSGNRRILHTRGAAVVHHTMPTTGPELREFLAPEVVLPVVGVALFVALIATTMGLLAQRRAPVTGVDGLVGERGLCTRDVVRGAGGEVQVHGELWQAVATDTIHRGQAVQIVASSGLVLEVEATP